MLAIMLTALALAASPARSQSSIVTWEKIFGPTTIPVGTTTVLTFNITNDNEIAHTTLAFTDNLPAGTQIAATPGVTNSCGGIVTAPANGTTISLTGGTVSPGTCTITVNILGTLPGTHVNVSGDLTSDAGNSGPVTDTLVVTAVPPPFAKSFAPDTVAVGNSSTLTFSIDNTANLAAATSLDFTDNLPAGTQVAATPNASTTCTGGILMAAANSGVISYTGGTVSASSTCTISVDVTGTTPGAHLNTTGDLTSSFGNSGTASDTLNVTVTPPLFSKLFAPDTINVGGISTLTFTIDNTANGIAATALTFADTLPAGTQIAAVPNATTSCTGGTLTAVANSTAIGYSGGTVNAASTCTVSVDVTGTVVGSHLNVSDNLTSSLGNSGTASDTLNVNAATTPPLFSKLFAPDTINLGATSTLTFSIDNTGNTVAATALAFADTLPAGTQIAAVPNVATTCNGGTITAAANSTVINYTGGSVAASASCTLSVDVTGTALGSHVNVSDNLTSSLGNSGTATDTLNVVGGLQLTKSFTDDPVRSGGTVTLEFTITNGDPTNSATSISFTDDLDAALPGLAATALPAANVCGAGSSISGTSLLTFTGGTLAGGASCTFAVTLNVPPNSDGSHTNTTSTITGIISGLPVTGPPATDDLLIRSPVQTTLNVIRNFVSQRIDLITIEDVLLTPHLNTPGSSGGTGPLTMAAMDGVGGPQVSFSTSLSRIARAHDAEKAAWQDGVKKAMALGYAGGSGPAAQPAPRFDIWARGVFTRYEDTAGTAREDGTFGLLYVGGEYKVAPDMLLGVLAQFDWTDEDDDRTRIGASGQGWMMGPYIVSKLAPDVYFQARAAWGKSDNDVTPLGTYTDSFDTTRWLVSGKIEGRYRFGRWRVSPIGSIIYFEENQKSYTDSLGNLIPDQTVSLGRASFGPEFAYGFDRGAGKHLELFGSITGVWDFDVEDKIVNGLAVGTDDFRARLEGGVMLTGPNGLRFRAASFVDGLGARDFDSYGGKVRVRVPLN